MQGPCKAFFETGLCSGQCVLEHNLFGLRVQNIPPVLFSAAALGKMFSGFNAVYAWIEKKEDPSGIVLFSEKKDVEEALACFKVRVSPLDETQREHHFAAPPIPPSFTFVSAGAGKTNDVADVIDVDSLPVESSSDSDAFSVPSRAANLLENVWCGVCLYLFVLY